jgi:hypothetical protein
MIWGNLCGHCDPRAGGVDAGLHHLVLQADRRDNPARNRDCSRSGQHRPVVSRLLRCVRLAGKRLTYRPTDEA